MYAATGMIITHTIMNMLSKNIILKPGEGAVSEHRNSKPALGIIEHNSSIDVIRPIYDDSISLDAHLVSNLTCGIILLRRHMSSVAVTPNKAIRRHIVYRLV